MKKIIFTLLGLLMITSASAASQTTFMPVLSEGKTWEVATIGFDFVDPTDRSEYYSVSVGGDTIVNNLTCKKILIVPKDNHKSSETAIAYEENGKVWNVNNNGEMELLFDISMHRYDSNEHGYVYFEDYICVNGVNRKRLTIDSGADCLDYSFYVVEGIGISSDKWLSMTYPGLGIAGDYEYACILSCSENGETIFTREDFSSPGIQLQHGDVNLDGSVTSADVTTLYDFLLGNTSEAPNTYDVNGDGTVTTVDVTAIYNVILGVK